LPVSWIGGQAEIDRIEQRLQELAVEMYMQGGSGSELVLFADSVDELITGSSSWPRQPAGDRFPRRHAGRPRRPGAVSRDLAELNSELQVVEAEQAAVSAELGTLAEEAQAAYSQLSGRCRDLTSRRNAEIAAARAAELARQRGASGGVGAIPGSAARCPGRRSSTPGAFPRSGGRSHKGVDMFHRWDAPDHRGRRAARCRSGTAVSGGRTIWLRGDDGYGYYYAHLNGFNVSSGQRVGRAMSSGSTATPGTPAVALRISTSRSIPAGAGGEP
jgi:murein DD-endopeptidase MepM/ murein hydrolase activator NlpD